MAKQLYSINEAAALLGKSPNTVREVARLRNIGQKPARDRLLSQGDIELLRTIIRDHSGRPPKPT